MTLHKKNKSVSFLIEASDKLDNPMKNKVFGAPQHSQMPNSRLRAQTLLSERVRVFITIIFGSLNFHAMTSHDEPSRSKNRLFLIWEFQFGNYNFGNFQFEDFQFGGFNSEIVNLEILHFQTVNAKFQIFKFQNVTFLISKFQNLKNETDE